MKTPAQTFYWFFGPRDYKNSGIFKYCETFIDVLRVDLDIKKKFIPFSASNPLRHIFQVFIFPIVIILFFRNSNKIFSDESFLLATFFPFFPYKKTFFIVHDYRNYAHTKKDQNFFDKIYFFLLKKSFKNLKYAHKVICGSSFTKSQLLKHIQIDPDKVVCIENSFKLDTSQDSDGLPKLKERILQLYHIHSKKKIILNVGSEEERKNFATILRAMVGLKDHILIKIGNPIIQLNRQRHLELVKNLGLQNIFFIDSVNDEHLEVFYTISNYYVSLSEFEGFGRTPIEAQMHGLPVIVSRIEPFLSNLGDSAMLIDNFHEPQELTDAILTLEKNQSMRQNLISKGRENAKRFDVQRNAEIFQNVLCGLT